MNGNSSFKRKPDKIFLKSRKFYFLCVAILLIAGIYLCRQTLLVQIGKITYYSDAPTKSDFLVILRGGGFDRTISAAKLYKSEYAKKILIQRSQGDEGIKYIKGYQIHIPTGQDTIKEILTQIGVPEKNVVLSSLSPGGGTVGEAYRVKKDLEYYKASSFIIVTSWYHSRRVKNIYRRILKNTEMQFWVVPSKENEEITNQWWHYRYVTRDVIMEIPRVICSFIFPTYNFNFEDDPKIG